MNAQRAAEEPTFPYCVEGTLGAEGALLKGVLGLKKKKQYTDWRVYHQWQYLVRSLVVQ